MKEDEKKAANAATNEYGTAAGYSEDYGAPKQEVYVDVDDQGYGTLTSNGAEGGGQPVNPFTKQQYDTQKSSNPFK